MRQVAKFASAEVGHRVRASLLDPNPRTSAITKFVPFRSSVCFWAELKTVQVAVAATDPKAVLGVYGKRSFQIKEADLIVADGGPSLDYQTNGIKR